jgi:hypothetical protein
MTLRTAKPLPPHRRPLLSLLYGALLDIDSLRATVDELRHEVGSADARRLLLHLEFLEGTAVRLLEQIEAPAAAVSH